MKIKILASSLLGLIACSTPSPSHSSVTVPIANEERGVVIPAQEETQTYSLNGLFLKMTKLGKPPLVILSHGSPIDSKYRKQLLLQNMVPEANEFLKLGFAVLLLERRGFGQSKEKYLETVGDCDHRDHIASGNYAANDVLAAVKYAQANLAVDPKSILLAGWSAGGYASLFAGSENPPGVRAIISLAGGRGAKGERVVCSEENLIEAFKAMGESSRIPSLWIYSENDQEFSPELAKSLWNAYQSGGGKAELQMVSAFGKDGHRLFTPAGFSRWIPKMEEFLDRVFAEKH